MGSAVTAELAQIQSSLARSVPALCVQSKHILSGAPAAEAAMPNIRVIPLNWWSNEKAQVNKTLNFALLKSFTLTLVIGRDLCQTQVCSATDGQNCHW